MALESWLRLCLAPEVGPVLGHRLLETFGAPEAVFTAPERQLLSVGGLGKARLARLLDPGAARLAREELARAAEAGVRLLTLADDDYPLLLSRLEFPPLVLWVRGRLAPADRLAVALVGPRSPSNYARLMLAELAPPLAAHGLTIVSGLAHGIDAEAHLAALDNGGRTLAVLGQGLGTAVYPQRNAELARRIVEEDRGALLSVFPLATEPGPGLFPQRNEIIAALSLGTLVIEAAETSGSLITARHAAAAGRVVMACPGDATRRAARGSNRLIADGAVMIQNAEDVLAALAAELRREGEGLGLGGRPATGDAGAAANAPGQLELDFTAPAPSAAPPLKPPAQLFALPGDPVSRAILELLDAEPLPADLLLEGCGERGHAPSAVLERLLRLEMDGILRQMPGRLYARIRR